MTAETKVKGRSHTRKGPGIMPHGKMPNPPGSKLVKRFIRDATGDNVEYRKLHKAMTGSDRYVIKCDPLPTDSGA